MVQVDFQVIQYERRIPNEIRSISGEERKKITFKNECSFDIRIYWVNYKGALKHVEDVSRGSSITQNTFVSHPWFITNIDESQILGIFNTLSKFPSKAEVILKDDVIEIISLE